jgi:hypothetical protein
VSYDRGVVTAGNKDQGLVWQVLKVLERGLLAQPDAELGRSWSSGRHQVNGYDRISGTRKVASRSA